MYHTRFDLSMFVLSLCLSVLTVEAGRRFGEIEFYTDGRSVELLSVRMEVPRTVNKAEKVVRIVEGLNSCPGP